MSFRSIYQTQPKKHLFVEYCGPGTIQRTRKRKASKSLSLLPRSLPSGATHPLIQSRHEDTFSYSLRSSQFFLRLLLNCHGGNPSTTGSLVIFELRYLFLTLSPSPCSHMHWAQPTTFASNLCKKGEAVSRVCPHPYEFARTDFLSQHCIYYWSVKHKSADAFSTCLLLRACSII